VNLAIVAKGTRRAYDTLALFKSKPLILEVISLPSGPPHT
jgi:hypothetical protein